MFDADIRVSFGIRGLAVGLVYDTCSERTGYEVYCHNTLMPHVTHR